MIWVPPELGGGIEDGEDLVVGHDAPLDPLRSAQLGLGRWVVGDPSPSLGLAQRGAQDLELVADRALALALLASAGDPLVDLLDAEAGHADFGDRVVLQRVGPTDLVALRADRPRRRLHLHPGVERVGHCLRACAGRLGLEVGRHPLGLALSAVHGLGPLDGLPTFVAPDEDPDLPDPLGALADRRHVRNCRAKVGI